MKKVLSMVLAGAMALGMGISTFAATYEASSDDMRESLGFCFSGDKTWTKVDDSNIEASEDVYAADEHELKFPLVYGMFVQDSEDVSKNGAWDVTKRMTASDIRKSKIVVRSQIKGGSKVITDLKIDTKKGEIVLEFADEWVSTKTQDFEIFIYLTIDGKRMDEHGVTVTGEFGNMEIPVYGDYDYVDIANGYVAVAEEFVPKIEVDLGNGISIFTKLFKDKKYYGTATRDDDENALVVYAKYPDIDNVVIMKTVGLNSTGDVVKMDVDYADYYVYDADMNYLGQASEMLPYSTRYYLANKKLDIVDDEGDEPIDEDDDVDDDGYEQSEGGGDGDNGSNANANPGTGR